MQKYLGFTASLVWAIKVHCVQRIFSMAVVVAVIYNISVHI